MAPLYDPQGTARLFSSCGSRARASAVPAAQHTPCNAEAAPLNFPVLIIQRIPAIILQRISGIPAFAQLISCCMENEINTFLGFLFTNKPLSSLGKRNSLEQCQSEQPNNPSPPPKVTPDVGRSLLTLLVPFCYFFM